MKDENKKYHLMVNIYLPVLAKDKQGALERAKSVLGMFDIQRFKFIQDDRTLKQNNALHLFFWQLAEELNAAGLDMKKVLKPQVDITWTTDSIKDYLWRPLQIALLKKKTL